MQEDYESALQVFQGFLSNYPSSTFVPSGWFWVGKAFTRSGRLDDAMTVYQKIIRDYPSSVKVEAAQYKVSLIQLRKKEIELSRLLEVEPRGLPEEHGGGPEPGKELRTGHRSLSEAPCGGRRDRRPEDDCGSPAAACRQDRGGEPALREACPTGRLSDGRGRGGNLAGGGTAGNPSASPCRQGAGSCAQRAVSWPDLVARSARRNAARSGRTGSREMRKPTRASSPRPLPCFWQLRRADSSPSLRGRLTLRTAGSS